MDMYLIMLGALLVVVCLSMGGFWGVVGTTVAGWVGAVALRDMRAVRPKPPRIKPLRRANGQAAAGADDGRGHDDGNAWEM